MILTFGVHKGKSLEEIPIGYLQWLAKPKYSNKFYKCASSTELNWKVPWDVKTEARRVLDLQGWELSGERWGRKE
jgi:hypothetical protein